MDKNSSRIELSYEITLPQKEKNLQNDRSISLKNSQPTYFKQFLALKDEATTLDKIQTGMIEEFRLSIISPKDLILVESRLPKN